jgi:HAD superfamily hydrolase (TIGR01509 family)
MIKAAVFDMDGLMFDTERVGRDAWIEVGKRLGFTDLEETNRRCLGCNEARCREIFNEIYGGRLTLDEVLAASRPISNKYYAEHGMPCKEGLQELLDYLKAHRIKIAMATSSNRSSAERNLGMAGLREYFDALICGDMIHKSKPDPDIYLTAAATLGVAPADCIGLEDSRNGIKSVHAAGMHGLLIPDLIPADEEMTAHAEAVLPTLRDVIGWLETHQ